MCNNCDKKCFKCKYVELVEEPNDTEYKEYAVFCTNPNNTMEKEWTSPSQRKNVAINIEGTVLEERLNSGQVLVGRYFSSKEINALKFHFMLGNIKNIVEM